MSNTSPSRAQFWSVQCTA